MTEHKRHINRIQKKILVEVDGNQGVIENISNDGGYLKTDKELTTDHFDATLKLNKYRSVKLSCKPQWQNNSGIGFKVLSVDEKGKQVFQRYIQRQFEQVKQYGSERVFKCDIFVTLEHTNAVGNVYFAKYFDYQGT